jgi:hypothetical protein
MTPERARTLWFAYWRAMRRYHRYTVEGLDHLETGVPTLIVGYHGRPIAHDLCMLQSLLWERTGRFPRAVMHGAAPKVPGLAELSVGMRFLTGEPEGIAQAVADGDPIIVTPGGTREGCRSVRHRYEVSWGERHGYLRVAARHGLCIVPTGARGVDDTYVGLNDGYALGKRLKTPGKMPVWFGVGPLGLWPLSPPFPVRITTRIGAPIHLPPLDPEDRAAFAAQHARVVAAVQGLMEWRP